MTTPNADYVPTTRYVVNAVAIFNVLIEVDAVSAEDAITQAKSNGGDIIDEQFDRFHPDTEFFANPAQIDSSGSQS